MSKFKKRDSKKMNILKWLDERKRERERERKRNFSRDGWMGNLIRFWKDNVRRRVKNATGRIEREDVSERE